MLTIFCPHYATRCLVSMDIWIPRLIFWFALKNLLTLFLDHTRVSTDAPLVCLAQSLMAAFFMVTLLRIAERMHCADSRRHEGPHWLCACAFGKRGRQGRIRQGLCHHFVVVSEFFVLNFECRRPPGLCCLMCYIFSIIHLIIWGLVFAPCFSFSIG